MSVFNQTYEQASYIKDLASSFMVLGYCTTVISLPCLKDLVSNQGFNVGIQSNI